MAPERVSPHAHRLPELLNALCDRTGLAGRGRPHGSLRPFANGPQPGPEMATAETASEAEEAFPRGVIRPDQPASMTEEAGDPPLEETDHAARTAEHGDAVPAAEMPVAMDAPSLVPSIESPAHPDAASDQDEIETFAARRKRLQARRKQASKSSRWTALVLVLFAFNVALVGARSEVVRFFPQTASLFAAVGLPGQSAQPEI